VARDQASELYSAGDVQEAKESKRNAASASAQEAHEAIRPSIVEGRFRQPKHLFFEDKKKADLYQLIYERTLASVMKDAKIERKVSQ
jgi:DNA topoisomerase IA